MFSFQRRRAQRQRAEAPRTGRKTDFCFLILVRCYQDLTLCISCLVFNLLASTEILCCEISTSMWCFAHASWRLDVVGNIGVRRIHMHARLQQTNFQNKGGAAERSVSERRRRGLGRKTDFCFLVRARCYQDLTLRISCLVFNLLASTEILCCELSTSMWCFAHASWRLDVVGNIGVRRIHMHARLQ